MTVACYLDLPKADHWMHAFAAGCGGKVVVGGYRDWGADDHASWEIGLLQQV